MEENPIGEENIDEENEEQKETRGRIAQRHKREIQELKKKSSTMLHSFSKNDKKAKKETQDAIKKMEDELKKKHEKELKEFDLKEQEQNTQTKELDPTLMKAMEKVNLKQEKQMKKAAAKVEAERELERQIAEEKKNAGTTKREIENQQLEQKLKPLGLGIHPILPDGNCLYNSIAHQLQFFGQKIERDYYTTLRSEAANYMLNHPDEFLPFLDSADGSLLSKEQFEAFCQKTAKTTAWGGQLELKALVNALKRPITIFTADLNSSEIEMGQEFIAEPLRLSYHRHAFGLGEHYNSVVPMRDEE